MQCKYIVLDGRFPILFDAAFIHAEVASGFPGREVTSAGFFRLPQGAYGESLSLGVGSKPEDTKLIREHLAL